MNSGMLKSKSACAAVLASANVMSPDLMTTLVLMAPLKVRRVTSCPMAFLPSASHCGSIKSVELAGHRLG